MQEGKFPRGVDPAIGIEPIEIYVAGLFGRTVKDPPVWKSPYTATVIPPGDKKTAERIVAQYGDPSEQAMERARAALRCAIDQRGELDNRTKAEKEDKRGGALSSVIMLFSGFFWAAFFSLGAAVFLRGGVLMRALAIAVVTRDGSDASRGRMLWRACVAWSWLSLGVVTLGFLIPKLNQLPALGLVATIVAILVAYSAARPDRSLPDLLAGTWLVPR